MKNKSKGILIGIAGSVIVAGAAFTATSLGVNGIHSNIQPEQGQEQLTPAKTNISSLIFNDIPDQEYTGQAITPAVIVLDGQNQLELNEDFSLEYSKNTAIGIADILITGKNDYEGEKTIHFNIVKQANSWLVNPDAATLSAGTPKYGTPQVFVKQAGAADSTYIALEYDTEEEQWWPAPEDEEALAQYYYGGQAITVKVVVAEGETFTGLEKVINFTIPHDVVVEDIPDQEYTGQAITPFIVVWDVDIEQMLEEDVDYTVEYSDNENIGVATVDITFIGEYADVETITQNFEIIKATNIWQTEPNVSFYSYDMSLNIYDGYALYGQAKNYLKYPNTDEFVEISSSYISNLPAGEYVFKSVIEEGETYLGLTYMDTFEIEKQQNSWMSNYIMSGYDNDGTIECNVDAYFGTPEIYYKKQSSDVWIKANSNTITVSESGTYDVKAIVEESDSYTGLNYTTTVTVTVYYNYEFVSDGQTFMSGRGNSVSLSQEPTKSGYVFIGWSTVEDDESFIVTGTYTLEQDTIFYAIFKEPLDFTFDGSKVMSYTGSDTAVVIPASYSTITKNGTTYYVEGNDTQVSMIGDGELAGAVFMDNTNLVSVEIPTSVTTINRRAFLRCTNLETVTGLDNVSLINHDAFGGCSSLVSIGNVDNVRTIDQRAFQDCTALETISLPNVTQINSDAFSGCTALETISLPNVTTIDNKAFFGCTALKTLIVSDKLTSFSTYGNSFGNNSAFEAIYIYGDNVANISYFSQIPNGSTIYVKDTLVSTYQTTYATEIANGNYTIAAITPSSE